MHRRNILGDMEASHFLSFLCGVVVMIGFSTLKGSNAEPAHQVYELRLDYVHEGKIDALKTPFADHTPAIFNRHHMKTIAYCSPDDPPSSHTLYPYILHH